MPGRPTRDDGGLTAIHASGDVTDSASIPSARAVPTIFVENIRSFKTATASVIIEILRTGVFLRGAHLIRLSITPALWAAGTDPLKRIQNSEDVTKIDDAIGFTALPLTRNVRV